MPPIRSTFILATLALLTSTSIASIPPSFQSIEALSQNSEIIVVGEVVDIQTVGKATLPSRNEMNGLVHKRATIEVSRAITTADAKPLKIAEVVVDYVDYEYDVVPRGWMSGTTILPSFWGADYPFAVGTFGMFPLRRGAAADRTQTAPAPTWRFTCDEGYGLFIPASHQPLNDKPATSAKDFLLRECAAVFARADVKSVAQLSTYLRAASAEVSHAICELMASEIIDDSRWYEIVAASLVGTAGFSKPISVIDLKSLSEPKDAGKIIPAFALNKLRPESINAGVLSALIKYQGSVRPTYAIQLYFMSDPLWVQLELPLLEQLKPGSLSTVAPIIYSLDFPLGAAAMSAARKMLNETRRVPPQDIHFPSPNDPPSDFFAALGLLERLGNEDDLANVLDRIKKSRTDDPAGFKAYLLHNEAPYARALQIYRLYLDETARLDIPTQYLPADLRLCDLAGSNIQELTGQNFGIPPNLGIPRAIETRDQALTKIRAAFNFNSDILIRPAATAPQSRPSTPPLAPVTGR